MVPPPPPGDMFEWITSLAIIVIVIVGAVFIVKFLLNYLQQSTPAIGKHSGELEAVMKDLLEEIKLLRKDIEKLREEMKE